MTPFRSRPRKTATALTLIGFFLLTSLVLAADYNAGVSATVLQKTSVTSNGEKITYPQTDRAEVTAMTVDLAPGVETGWHQHPVLVYAYVVAGNLSVELADGKILNYRAGEAIIEVVNTLHNGKNKGTEPVRLAVFYLGSEGRANVIKRESVKENVK